MVQMHYGLLLPVMKKKNASLQEFIVTDKNIEKSCISYIFILTLNLTVEDRNYKKNMI